MTIGVLAGGLASPASAGVVLAAGTDAGVPGQMRAFDSAGTMLLDINPYGGFTGGVRVAVGDVSGDDLADVIVGAGPGAPGGHVKVFDGASGAELRSFFAYPSFQGGVYVGAGDVSGDGVSDLITGADASAAGGHVKVFDGVSGAELRSFFAYDTAFSGGVRVAGGDVNGDGFDDIITGAGAGGAGHVKVFDGRTGAELSSFLAYPGFGGGVHVSAGDVDGDGLADIITGAAANGHVKVFDGADSAELASFFAFDGFSGGVSVAAGDLNGDGRPDLAGALGGQSLGEVRLFSPSGAPAGALAPFGVNYTGGIFIGAAPIPEPATIALLGLTAILVGRRR